MPNVESKFCFKKDALDACQVLIAGLGVSSAERIRLEVALSKLALVEAWNPEQDVCLEKFTVRLVGGRVVSVSHKSRDRERICYPAGR